MAALDHKKLIGVSLAVFAVLLLANAAMSKPAEKDKSTDIYPEVWHVADLPVYRMGDDSKAEFDPSILMALIEQSLPAKSWENGSIAVPKDLDSSIVTFLTQEDHERVAGLIKSLRKPSAD